MKEYRAEFLSQGDDVLTYEDKIEADLQLAKLLSYLGESNEAMEILRKHVE
jgi:hypothetical protein